MKSQDSNVKVNSGRIGWGPLSPQSARPQIFCYACKEETAALADAPRLYFDIATRNAAPLGRIEVELAAFDSLPRLVENVRLIASNERAPRCSFDGSQFRHAPQGPQYK